MADSENMKEASSFYTIKFIPEAGEVKSLRLSKKAAKLLAVGAASVALVFSGALGAAIYSGLTARGSASEAADLRSVNEIQQEQLLKLSQKANALQDEVNSLTELETDLRRQTGAQPAQVKHDGQGGPYVEPQVKTVETALSLLEGKVAERKSSLEALKEELKTQRESLGLGNVPAFGTAGYSPAVTTPSIWPCSGDVSSPYGLRWGGSDFHPGIDIADDMGTPIMATADGTVEVAGWNSGGYGNMVDIDHGNGIMTRYGHASQVVVTAGQYVRRGQIIAYMGSTGYSTGPHCHYEVRINGQAVNPATYLY